LFQDGSGFTANLNEHTSALDPNGVTTDVFGQRSTESGTGSHVKPPLMKRTLNLVTLKKAVAKSSATVGAKIGRRVDLLIHAIQSNFIAIGNHDHRNLI
jgi:hypothetical protein